MDQVLTCVLPACAGDGSTSLQKWVTSVCLVSPPPASWKVQTSARAQQSNTTKKKKVRKSVTLVSKSLSGVSVMLVPSERQNHSRRCAGRGFSQVDWRAGTAGFQWTIKVLQPKPIIADLLTSHRPPERIICIITRTTDLALPLSMNIFLLGTVRSCRFQR